MGIIACLMKRDELLFIVSLLIFSIGVLYFTVQPSCPEPKIVTVSTTTTVSFTTTVTKFVPVTFEKTLNDVTVKLSDTYIYRVVGTRTYVVLPADYFILEDDVKTLLEIDNSKYLSYISFLAASYGVRAPEDISDYNEWGTFAMNITRYFDYDTERALRGNGNSIESYLPDTLISVHSGVCGDFAFFYAALFLEKGYTVTYLVLDFKNYGHAALEVSGIVMQNNRPGLYSDSFFAEWLYAVKTPYTVYSAVIAPTGLVTIGTTVISTSQSYPVEYSICVTEGASVRVCYYFSRSGTVFTFSGMRKVDKTVFLNVISYSNGYLWSGTTPYSVAFSDAIHRIFAEMLYPMYPITVYSGTTVYFTYGPWFYAYGFMHYGTFTGTYEGTTGVSLEGEYSVKW